MKAEGMTSIPISARVSAAQSVNAAMLAILSSVNAKGGAFASVREAIVFIRTVLFQFFN